MRISVGRVLLAALLVPALIGMLAGPAFGIVYGEPDNGAHPFVGSMLYDSGGDGTLDQRCSGTLISPTVFLTAAHCVVGLDPEDVAVTFDDVITDDPTVYYGAAIAHPEYGSGGQSDAHDIAVIIFEKPIGGITPATLPTAGLLDDLKASHDLNTQYYTAVGYGTVRETRTGGFDSILDNTERRQATQTANSLTSAWFTLSMNEATGDGGTCYGDSGGPHLLGTGTDATTVVSITVTGDAVCKATDKTYRLDTAVAREFLSEFVTLP
jgi:secreted trypsin-like serine protease